VGWETVAGYVLTCYGDGGEQETREEGGEDVQHLAVLSFVRRRSWTSLVVEWTV
jgi:hypothetical protein